MSRIIRGTQDAKGRIMLKQAEGGMGRIRCPKCQCLAIDAIDSRTGTKVKRCQGCGNQFTLTPMGSARPPAASLRVPPRPQGVQRPGNRTVGKV